MGWEIFGRGHCLNFYNKLIYVAGPYSGPTPDYAKCYGIISENISIARLYGKKIWEMGAVAIVPHLNTAHFELDCDVPLNRYYSGDLVIISRCDAIFMMPGWENSVGSRKEFVFASNRSMVVFYCLNAIKEWLSKFTPEEKPSDSWADNDWSV